MMGDQLNQIGGRTEPDALTLVMARIEELVKEFNRQGLEQARDNGERTAELRLMRKALDDHLTATDAAKWAGEYQKILSRLDALEKAERERTEEERINPPLGRTLVHLGQSVNYLKPILLFLAMIFLAGVGWKLYAYGVSSSAQTSTQTITQTTHPSATREPTDRDARH